MASMAALLGVRLSGSTRHENLNGIYLLEPDLRTNGCDVVRVHNRLLWPPLPPCSSSAGPCRHRRQLAKARDSPSPRTARQFSKPSESSKQTSYIYRNDKECWMVAPQKAHMAKNVGCIASIDAGAAS